MICQQLTSILGLECHQLDAAGQIALIETPFRFADGDHVPLYVENVGHKLRFFDDGATVMHFIGRGINADRPRAFNFIKSAAQSNGGDLSEAGDVEVWTSMDTAPQAFVQYITTMIALVAWEQDKAGVSHDAELFVDEVALCLTAWKAGHEVKRGPKLSGITGKEHELNFEVDGTLYLAISAHHNAASAALHKLIDIRGAAVNAGISTMVVIDDRDDPKAAESESKVISSVSRVMSMSQLQKHAGLSASRH